ncbi:MAG: RasGEF domain-containing protein, partial [archaeon]|nr:RasGEF domain-containing protein [archaeon]
MEPTNAFLPSLDSMSQGGLRLSPRSQKLSPRDLLRDVMMTTSPSSSVHVSGSRSESAEKPISPLSQSMAVEVSSRKKKKKHVQISPDPPNTVRSVSHSPKARKGSSIRSRKAVSGEKLQSASIEAFLSPQKPEKPRKLRGSTSDTMFSKLHARKSKSTRVASGSAADDDSVSDSSTSSHHDLGSRSAGMLGERLQSPSSLSLVASLQSQLQMGTSHFQGLPKAMTLLQIMERLQMSFTQYPDTAAFDSELCALFCCYSFFVDTSSLVRFITDRYVVWTQQSTLFLASVTSQFIAVFCTSWIRRDSRLADHYHDLMIYFSSNHHGLSSQCCSDVLGALIEARNRRALEASEDAAILSLRTTSVEKRRDLRKTFFLLSPADAAAHLQSAHLRFYRRVNPWELLEYLRKRPSDACAQVPQHFNHTVAWIQTICLKPSAARSRAKNISRWIYIAQACHQASYLTPLLVILTALGHQVLSRLKQTWELLPPPALELFNTLHGICAASNNYTFLRQMATDPSVPLPLAIVSKDLTMTLEVTPPPTRDEEAIPYDQYRHFGMLLARSHLPALSEATREDDTRSSSSQSELFVLLTDPLPRLLEDRLFHISYLHEPPAHEQQEVTVTTNPLLRGRPRTNSISGSASLSAVFKLPVVAAEAPVSSPKAKQKSKSRSPTSSSEP